MSHCIAGIAGGADIILLPEIPYDIKSIAKVIDGRSKAGKPFTILAVAEGAISKEDAKLKKKRIQGEAGEEEISVYRLRAGGADPEGDGQGSAYHSAGAYPERRGSRARMTG